MSPREAFAIIEERRATMYDPAIIDAFRDVHASAATLASAPASERPQPIAIAPDHAAADSGPGVADARLALALGAALATVSGDDAWQVLGDALRQLPAVDTAAIFVVDGERQCLRAMHASGRHARLLDPLCIPVGERLSGWVAATGRPMMNADAALDLFETNGCLLKSAIAVPCWGPGGERAVLTLYSAREQAFSPMHQRLLEAAAAFVNTAVGEPRVWRGITAVGTRWPDSTRH
jgi:hypothetical protein